MSVGVFDGPPRPVLVYPDTGDESKSATIREEAPRSASNKVLTLTNWKRLPNVPPSVNLGGMVQPGVYWREFLVFLVASPKTQLYLYHLKSSVWSSMDSINLCKPAAGCPLAVFEGSLVLFSSSGSIYSHVMETGRWKQSAKLSSNLNSTSGQEAVVLVSTGSVDKTPLLLLSKDHPPGLTSRGKGSSYLCLRQFQASKWSPPMKLRYSFLDNIRVPTRISYATSQSNLYVCNGSIIYCINPTITCAVDQVEVSTVDVSSLGLTSVSICSVNETIFSFGGKDEDDQPTSSVYRYSSQTKEWEPAGYMRSCRFSATVTPYVPQDGTTDNTNIIVVGGEYGSVKDSTVLPCQIAEVCEVGVSSC